MDRNSAIIQNIYIYHYPQSLTMNYPIVGQAALPNKMDEGVYSERVLYNEMDRINFVNRYGNKPRVIIQYRDLNEAEMAVYNQNKPLLRPAEYPANQPNKQARKITAITAIMSLWAVITNNPLISTIIGTIIATLILSHYHVI